MIITKTPFPGVLVIKVNTHRDARGCFYESWSKEAYREAGIPDAFLQDNISTSQKNVLRGLHFHTTQGQLMGVLRGSILDVVVDLRPQSPLFKKHFSMELSGDSPQQIYMPPGFAHGFCVLSDEAILNYKCTQYYDPKKEKGVFWNDPELGIAWPLQDPILSARDQKFPLFREIFEFIEF